MTNKDEKKRVTSLVPPQTMARKRPDPEIEPPKIKKSKIEDKYISIATDGPQEQFKAIGDKVQAREVKWAYYAIDGNKGYHHYLVLQTN